ncbi:MAG: hypothetical protein ACREPG_00585 [Candidatus Binatia bacterium]
MNQLIDTHGKAIITGLLVVIAVLAIMLFGSCSTVGSKQVSDKNLAAFLDALADPNENVHGVLLIAPDRHDRLVVLNARLEPTKPCFWDAKSILTAEKTPVLLPPECVKEGSGIEVLYDKQQVLTITPATRPAKEGRESIVYFADLDHRVVCTQPDGICP